MSKILVADDDPDIRALLFYLLEDAGHEVSEAANGRSAVHQVQQEVPDLVLLDVLMPIMDGIQVLKQLRDNPETKSLPVVMLTDFSILDEQNPSLETPFT